MISYITGNVFVVAILFVLVRLEIYLYQNPTLFHDPDDMSVARGLCALAIIIFALVLFMTTMEFAKFLDTKFGLALE